MNEKEKRKAESRIRILDVAAALFREKGFSATGVDEIMAGAGLTAGAFYAHFRSKQELFDRTLEHVLAQRAARLTKDLGDHPVMELLRRYVCEGHRDHPEQGCVIPSVASEIARHSSHGKEILGGYIDRWADLFAQYLDGTPRERRDKALRLVSQAVGAVLLSRLVPETLSGEILKAGRNAEAL